MADQKLTVLAANTDPVSTDLLYIVDDPDGAPTSEKVDVRYIVGTGDARNNLIKNSPGQIVIDGAEPQWWDDVANATITDEDAAGEAIPDKTKQVFKVVTTANDVYGYQTFTCADELLLDVGVTVLSLSVWVYCASANKASIALYGTNLGLQESSQVGAGAWELLTVENITLDAADATFEVRFIVDTGTAYFTMPMLNTGSRPFSWMLRGEKFVAMALASQYDLDTTGDVAWSDTDCTANSHPLALGLMVEVWIYEGDGTAGSQNNIGHSDDLTGGDAIVACAIEYVIAMVSQVGMARVACNDSQIIRYQVVEQDADNDVRARLLIAGYWMWA